MRAEFQTPGRKSTKLNKVCLLFLKQLNMKLFFLTTYLKESSKSVDFQPLIQFWILQTLLSFCSRLCNSYFSVDHRCYSHSAEQCHNYDEVYWDSSWTGWNLGKTAENSHSLGTLTCQKEKSKVFFFFKFLKKYSSATLSIYNASNYFLRLTWI